MAKTVRWHYTVVGTGHFPHDMLRYDQAWPADSGRGMSNFFADAEERLSRRPQELVGLNEPTVDRWNSFGWYVDPDTIRKESF